MALQVSLGKYRNELADAASRTFTRPSSTAPARVSTPKPAASTSAPAKEPFKRTHDTAFSQPPSTGTGAEMLTQVYHAIEHLKAKGTTLGFDDVIAYLSLPLDSRGNIPRIRTALMANERVQYVDKGETGTGKEGLKYRPLHPVTNARELKIYLQRQPTAQYIRVNELKDGWPECVSGIDKLEESGDVLVIRNKKDDTPKYVWMDSSEWKSKISSEFADFISKCKLPATENEVRNELSKAGLTPTSQVKENSMINKKKERKKANRRGGKTTNSHMVGILKDYSNKR